MHTADTGHRVEIADDPVTALIAVLMPSPKALEDERSEAAEAPVNEPDDVGSPQAPEDERSEDIGDMLS
jgi:hypothetical protein